MKFSIKDFFNKYDQIRRKLRILSHLLKKSLMEKFIFCAVLLLPKVPENSRKFLNQISKRFLTQGLKRSLNCHHNTSSYQTTNQLMT